MKIAVGIATAGRCAILSEMLQELAKQTRLPDLVAVCPARESDVRRPEPGELPFPVEVINGKTGSSPQRNAIIDRLTDFDLVVFFDDDFFPTRDYLANAQALFEHNKAVVVATGRPLEDGIKGPGFSPAYARDVLARHRPATAAPERFHAYYGAYGCNMVVRLDPVRKYGVIFDEALPLYAWQEDVDFSRQLASFGEVVCSEGLTGVHLGAKNGRTSGLKFGYSQIANPIYLASKGTMSLKFAARTMGQNVLANVVKAWKPEPYVDRIGRCKGNLLALGDLLRGELHPGRILELD
jgi:GT2 family glycosyltransferase